jgi:hypothetical protein
VPAIRFITLGVMGVALLASCADKGPSDSSYVLVRNVGVGPSDPATRAYFMDGDAQMNGIECREVVTLANEAVDVRRSRGETSLVKYECVSLREARERGFK